MKTQHKLITLFSALTIFSGCDGENLVDDRGDVHEPDEDRPDAPQPPDQSFHEDDAMKEVPGEDLDGPDELAEALDPSAASCVGYYNGGNFCLASCWDKPGTWIAVGHLTNTAYGKCSGKVDNYCAWHGGTYGACWGWP